MLLRSSYFTLSIIVAVFSANDAAFAQNANTLSNPIYDKCVREVVGPNAYYGNGRPAWPEGLNNTIYNCVQKAQTAKPQQDVAPPSQQQSTQERRQPAPPANVGNARATIEAQQLRDEAARLKAEAEAARRQAEKAAAEAKAEAEAARKMLSDSRGPAVSNVMIAVPDATAAVNNDNAIALNKRIGELAGQISVLQTVLKEQNDLKKTATPETSGAFDNSVTAIEKRIDALKKEYSERDRNFSKYLTSIKPNDRDLYLTARKASEIYPKIPYYIPGTSETGEFWVEPTVSDKGDMSFSFKFIDIQASIDKVRGKIDMTLPEIEDAQKALFKLYEWSVIAHKQKIRKNFEKRVTCFPSSECPPDGERIDGKASTEVRFNVYEDGSTAGRIQRNKGRFIEGYNISIDSAMLLQAYLNHVIKEAKMEFNAGTQDKKSLDKLFQ
jgi:hypothetical protein